MERNLRARSVHAKQSAQAARQPHSRLAASALCRRLHFLRRFSRGKNRFHLLRQSRLLRVFDSDQAARDATRATALTCASSSGGLTTRRSLPASRHTASPSAHFSTL